MQNKTKKSNKGFTLLETLLAIALFSSLILAPLSIASNGLSSAIASKERITAIALAQDALEYIRATRDTNRLNNVDWLSGLDGSQQCRYNINGNGHKGCRVDTLASSVDRIKPNDDTNFGFIRLDTNTGLYGYNVAWIQTKFTRYAIVDELVDGREARITAVVNWQTPFTTKTVSVVELLTNW